MRALRALPAQLLLWAILPLVVLLAVLAFSSVYVHQATMRRTARQMEMRLARAEAHGLAAVVSAQLGALELVERALEAGAPPEEALSAARPLLQTARMGLVVLGPEGRAEAALPQPAPAEVVDLELPQRSGFPELALTRAADGAWLLVAASRSPTAETRLYRVLGPQLEISGWDHLLLDADARIYGLTPGSPSEPPWPPGARARAGPESFFAYRGGLGEAVAGLAPVGGTPWTLAATRPFRPEFGPGMTYAVAAPLVLLAAIVGGGLAMAFGVRNVLRPLRMLGAHASRLAWGDQQAIEEPVGGVAEVEELRLVLVEMSRRLRDYQRGLESYASALTRGQEEERRRLARELHDQTAQELVALVQRLDQVRRGLGRPGHDPGTELTRLRGDILRALEGVRRMSQALRPSYLEDLGLLPALEALVAQARQPGRLSLELRVEGEPARLPGEVELALYRVAQEAVHNTLRHAQASHGRLRLRFDPEEVRLVMEDDGRGFQAPETLQELVQRGHLGLMGMRERVLLLGGRLEITSEPGRETRVEAIVPRSDLQAGQGASDRAGQDRSQGAGQDVSRRAGQDMGDDA